MTGPARPYLSVAPSHPAAPATSSDGPRTRRVSLRGEGVAPARVFISYAHDDTEHEDRVREF